MTYSGVFLRATCPDHGDRLFLRCEPCQWWYCPDRPCSQVIPDERVTPDGADVVEWDRTAANYYCGTGVEVVS